MKPIIRLILIPAIARIGSAQNGCNMFATDSPIDTAIVVPGSDACRLMAAGITSGPTTAQRPPPLGTKSVITSAVRQVKKGNV
jgi:hypothetical protein